MLSRGKLLVQICKKNGQISPNEEVVIHNVDHEVGNVIMDKPNQPSSVMEFEYFYGGSTYNIISGSNKDDLSECKNMNYSTINDSLMQKEVTFNNIVENSEGENNGIVIMDMSNETSVAEFEGFEAASTSASTHNRNEHVVSEGEYNYSFLNDASVQEEVTMENTDQEDASTRHDLSSGSDDDFVPPPDESSSTSEGEHTTSDPKRARWSKRNIENWKSNVEKKTKKEGKKPRVIDCSKCKFRCSEKFYENSRLNICEEFWKLNYCRQKDYILKTVVAVSPLVHRARSGIRKPKLSSRSYFLFKDGKKLRTCKGFYLKTLSISHGPVDAALSGVNEVGVYDKPDNRGRRPPANKTPSELIAKVKSHIESFPRIESHYCRNSTKREYLEQNLSIAKMYSLYLEQCKLRNEVEYVSEIVYRRTFCTNYNLSFYKPKKDQCVVCENHKSNNNDDNEYADHIRRKNEAYDAKKVDKERAITDANFLSASFDLQSVLQIPSSEVSLMYYSRKLCMYNLTIYESAPPNKAHCYAWTELNGQKGSCEIGTALYNWLRQIPEKITEISLFSDTCAGQNRNQYIAALFLHCVRFTNIKVIEHKFMEKGHSFMEVDSMHSSIENAKRGISVYSIHDWLNIFKNTRSKRVRSKADIYNVTQLHYSDMLDLKGLAASFLKNKNIDESGKKVNWLKIKIMRYEKDNPESIFFKYNYSDTEYSIIKIGGRRSRSKDVTINLHINGLYKKLLPISEAKKKDLIKLCRSGAIPNEFHAWYHSLPANKKNDLNPEPDHYNDSEYDDDE